MISILGVYYGIMMASPIFEDELSHGLICLWELRLPVCYAAHRRDQQRGEWQTDSVLGKLLVPTIAPCLHGACSKRFDVTSASVLE